MRLRPLKLKLTLFINAGIIIDITADDIDMAVGVDIDMAVGVTLMLATTLTTTLTNNKSHFMRLAQHLTALRVALGATNVCLLDENPTCSVPAS